MFFVSCLFYSYVYILWGFPGGTSGKEPTCLHRRRKRRRFHPWVGKTPWRRAWQHTPVFLPEESHGQRSLAGYRPWGREESDTTEVTHAHTHTPMPLFTWRAWPHSAHSLAKCHPVMSFTAIKMWLNARMWAQTPTEVTTHRMSECFDSVLLSVEEDNV